MAFEIQFCLRFRVILIASWITQNTPIQQHGIHTIKFKITALVDNVYVFDLQTHKLRHRQGHFIVMTKRYARPKGAAPSIKTPVLNLELATFLYINRAVVPQPRTVIRDCVPMDIFMSWIGPYPFDRRFCVFLDLGCAVKNVLT